MPTRLDFPLLDGGLFDPPPPLCGPDLPESPLGDRRRPREHYDGTNPESWSPEWQAHLEQLARRAADGVETATGYTPWDLSGFNAE